MLRPSRVLHPRHRLLSPLASGYLRLPHRPVNHVHVAQVSQPPARLRTARRFPAAAPARPTPPLNGSVSSRKPPTAQKTSSSRRSSRSPPHDGAQDDPQCAHETGCTLDRQPVTGKRVQPQAAGANLVRGRPGVSSSGNRSMARSPAASTLTACARRSGGRRVAPPALVWSRRPRTAALAPSPRGVRADVEAGRAKLHRPHRRCPPAAPARCPAPGCSSPRPRAVAHRHQRAQHSVGARAQARVFGKAAIALGSASAAARRDRARPQNRRTRRDSFHLQAAILRNPRTSIHAISEAARSSVTRKRIRAHDESDQSANLLRPTDTTMSAATP